MTTNQPLLSEEVKQKWEPVITAEGVDEIKNRDVRNTTIRLLENTEKAALEEGVNTGNMVSGGGQGFDPILISMVRRTMPSLIAHDIVGVQPMSGPTGLIFAMRARYTGDPQTGAEAFGTSAPDVNHSGNGAGAAMTTAAGEALGVDIQGDGTTDGTTARTAFTDVTNIAQTNPWAEMSFSIDKKSVEAGTRALKAKYTIELAQDLKAIHGMDAEAELANILSTEVVGEINREIIATMRSQARTGAQNTNVAGTFDMTGGANDDTDGRWEIEKYKNLYMQIVREASLIATTTRRGVGNFIVCSPIVMAALEQATKLDTAAISGTLNSDFVGATFAGILGGRFKVYVDPYAAADFVTVGYKGANVYDAGMFYCPYVPLQMMKAVGEEDFQPRIGMKTRYAIAYNPFVSGIAGQNDYYRDFLVTGV